MSTLTVDYVALLEGVRELSGLFLKVGREVEEIVGYTRELDLFWDGGANSAYIGKVGEDLAAIAEISVKIRDTIRILGLILDVYLENEKEIMKLTGEYVI